MQRVLHVGGARGAFDERCYFGAPIPSHLARTQHEHGERGNMPVQLDSVWLEQIPMPISGKHLYPKHS